NGRLLQERRGRAADAHAALQPLEVAAAALVKHNDRSVEERLAGGEARGQIRQLRVVRGDVASGTRTQLDAAVADAADGAHAVPLDFKKPGGVGKRTVFQRSERRLQARGEGRFARAFEIGRA